MEKTVIAEFVEDVDSVAQLIYDFSKPVYVCTEIQVITRESSQKFLLVQPISGFEEYDVQKMITAKTMRRRSRDNANWLLVYTSTWTGAPPKKPSLSIPLHSIVAKWELPMSDTTVGDVVDTCDRPSLDPRCYVSLYYIVEYMFHNLERMKK
jgi:hypothetical protein